MPVGPRRRQSWMVWREELIPRPRSHDGNPVLGSQTHYRFWIVGGGVVIPSLLPTMSVSPSGLTLRQQQGDQEMERRPNRASATWTRTSIKEANRLALITVEKQLIHPQPLTHSSLSL